MSRKRSFLWPFLASLLLMACSSEETPTKPEAPIKNDAQWSQYIAEHSDGLISSRSPLRIRFVADVIDEAKINEPPKGMLSISPEANFSVRFENPREMNVVFAEPLKSATRYTVTLNKSALQGIPDTLKDYQFAVEVIPQSLYLAGANLELMAGDYSKYLVQGTLRTADVAEAEKVQKSLSLKVANERVALNWQPSPDGMTHGFLSAPIERLDTEQTALLSWDGSELGTKDSSERSLTVPAKGVFAVTQMIAEFAEQPIIHVDFSEPLDEKQNLKGLYSLDNTNATHRVSGTRLSLFLDNNRIQEITVSLSENIRSYDGRKLNAQTRQTVAFASVMPAVKFVGTGNLLPDADRISLPFEAVNVASVDVTAFRVFDNNLGQFLQVNTFDGSRELRRVGRNIWRKRVTLDNVKMNQTGRYAIDVSDLFSKEPGALYRFTLSINRGQSLYVCSAADRAVPVPEQSALENGDEYDESDSSGWDFSEYYYEDYDGNWQDRGNPCKDSYFNHHQSAKSSRNFLAANIGLIVKQGSNGVFHIVSTNIKTGTPLAHTEVSFYNYQNQVLKTVVTDGQGMAELKSDVRPFYAVAKQGSQRGYLKLNNGLALATSHFDVGGATTRGGVKGAIYGERGVWRPGDTLYLTFVLHDSEKALPENHPATLELISPQGQVQYSKTNTQPLDGFYPFAIKTLDAAETGLWRARVRLGNHEFERSLKIETVMPNRLKIELRTPETLKLAEKIPLSLFSEWLHGASASGLKADVAVKLKPKATRFTRGEGYSFDDPTRQFEGGEQKIFEGELNQNGEVEFIPEIVAEGNKSGTLSAEFTTRVFEPGGAFSIATQSATVHPFAQYVGIKLPKGDQARNMLLTDRDHAVEILTLNADGDPVSVKEVEMDVYKLEWRWWWEQSANGVASFEQDNSYSRIANGISSTVDGNGQWTFQVKYPDWGRYLVRACDKAGGHCAAQVVYIDWPGWAGRAQEQSGPGANALTLFSDKKVYKVGETAVINLPAESKGRALLSIENGVKVLQQRWLELDGTRSQIELPIVAGMAPNIYVSVTLLQAHQGKTNDRPIRLYGVMPLLVEDPQTQLEPQLTLPSEVKPESTFTIAVSEKNGKAMTYTVAVVDDGLLGLTNFKVPRLHGEFYQREALGVRTWDMFDYVIGAYGAELERLLALGGSDEGAGNNAKRERKRFPPVVKFLGPFSLDAGKSAEHTVTLPPYVGSVRAMIVAGKAGAFGSAEKSLAVRQALMVQATMPRVIGPGETVRAPVSVFVMDKGIQSVQLSAQTDALIQRVNDTPIELSFAQTGDKVGFIDLKVGDKLGKSRIKFMVTSGKEKAEQTIDIDVRAANPMTTISQRLSLKPGEKQTLNFAPHGMPGSNESTLEIASIPPLNLAQRLDYLIRYPHGCVEQTTSGAFPQLYLSKLLELTPQQSTRASENVQRGIERLRQFQLSSGGFGYWPGHNDFNSWSTTYVGHFLLEAQRAGHIVPATMVSEWRGFQQNRARTWVPGNSESTLDQAYRLYTLALSGQPELGAMNRLREQAGLVNTAKWLLAASYKLAGIQDVAAALVKDASLGTTSYRTEGYTFGSELRDQAILLESVHLLKDEVKTQDLMEAISSQLSSEAWHSTQTVSWSLLSLAHVVGEGRSAGINLEWALGQEKSINERGTKPIIQVPLTKAGDGPFSLSLNNRSEANAYLSLVNRGVAKAGAESAAGESLSIDIRFTDAEGQSVDVKALAQGKDIRATTTVRNTSPVHLTNLALTQVVPSGWEIMNSRMAATGITVDESSFDYRDVRDDRVHTYFGLKSGESKTYVQVFNISYPGRYYLPAWNVEAMYDAKRFARNVGQWVQVQSVEVKPAK